MDIADHFFLYRHILEQLYNMFCRYKSLFFGGGGRLCADYNTFLGHLSAIGPPNQFPLITTQKSPISPQGF